MTNEFLDFKKRLIEILGVPSTTSDGKLLEAVWCSDYERRRLFIADMERTLAANTLTERSFDEKTIDAFSIAMKQKMELSRQKGREKWFACEPTDLSAMLREHVEKGDPVDVANFCMMLWYLGSRIANTSDKQAQSVMSDDSGDALDAKRYRWLRDKTRGWRIPTHGGTGTSRQVDGFEFPLPEPVGNVMQGSVAQHLDDAIDAAIKAQSGEAT